MALASLWNLLAGYAGLVSVGQQAYVGLGAYVLFARDHAGSACIRCSPIPLAGVVGAIVALPVAGLIFRLRGHYFAIGTWVVAEVFRLLASQVSVLGGGSGISLPVGIVTAMAPTRQLREFLIYWLALAIVVVGARRDRAAAALALRPGAHGDPRQRARGAVERRRRRAHQAHRLCADRVRHRHGGRADLPAEAAHLARPPPSTSTIGPPT